MVMNHLKLIHQ